MKPRGSIILLLLVLVLHLGCAPDTEARKQVLRAGAWHMEMDLNGLTLPFQLDLVQQRDSSWNIHIHNGVEDILVTAVSVNGDSIHMRMPLFDSEFLGVLESDSTMHGVWVNRLKGPDYRIPFRAHAGKHPRFPIHITDGSVLSGVWETHFSRGTADAYPATGVFEQHTDGRVTGTFLTETGDYRYLEGAVYGDSLKLSCFDGSHAMLFHASLDNDSLRGHFWSGTHWDEPWIAFRNPDHKLRDPDSLTYLKEGYDMVDFTFNDLDGTPVSPSDDRFKGKLLVIQIMGSWCPNCVDESQLLKEVYTAHHTKGLELISIAFERQEDTLQAIAGLRRYQETLGLDHTILYGGRSGKGVAADRLPFLNHVMSFPTCIFVDRKGKVRRIHTGFYGPGTGEYYTAYKADLNAFVDQLLQEQLPALVARN